VEKAQSYKLRETRGVGQIGLKLGFWNRG